MLDSVARPRAASVQIVAALAIVVLQQACAGADSGSSHAATKALRGIATVIDGDGLYVDTTEVRLFGIDAPEIGQYCRRDDGTRWRCGQYSTVALDRLAGGERVECRVHTTDSFGRSVATCKREGQDVGAKQVGEGWALAYRRFSDRYVGEEDGARVARAGIWAGDFEPPWEWRRRQRSGDGKKR